MADGHVAFEQMLVHNLKSPLTGILASLELLHDGDLGTLTADQRAAIHTMRQQGAVLVRMIDELLDVGRVGSPAFHVQLVPLDPSGFLVDVRSGWSGRLPRLTSVIAPDVPDVIADADVLRRVFDNLLMNALVHAGAGTAVTLRAERAGDVVRFTVADDGPGITATDAQRIFEPFVTLDPTGTRKAHGLGLAYCRSALAAMGGTITVVPGGQGATFAVELPAAVVLPRQALEQDQ